MIETFLSLEPKDKFTVVGIALTTFLTFLNIILTLYNSKKNLYANTILKERLESLNKLKLNSAQFLSLIKEELRLKNRFQNSYKNIYELKHNILYQFNSQKNEELIKINEIKQLTDFIFILSTFSTISEIEEYTTKNSVYFFSKLNYENYDFQRIEKVLYNQIEENLDKVEIILSLHIKEEWEKVKKKS